MEVDVWYAMIERIMGLVIYADINKYGRYIRQTLQVNQKTFI
jgi:hypothetical protein